MEGVADVTGHIHDPTFPPTHLSTRPLSHPYQSIRDTYMHSMMYIPLEYMHIYLHVSMQVYNVGTYLHEYRVPTLKAVPTFKDTYLVLHVSYDFKCQVDPGGPDEKVSEVLDLLGGPGGMLPNRPEEEFQGCYKDEDNVRLALTMIARLGHLR